MYGLEIVLVKWIICVWVERGFGSTEVVLQGFVVNQSYRDMLYMKPPRFMAVFSELILLTFLVLKIVSADLTKTFAHT